MLRSRSRRYAPLAIAILIATASLFAALSLDFLVFRLIVSETGINLDATLDDIRTAQIDVAGNTGRFWSAPGISLGWPFCNVMVPHWLTILLGAAWVGWSSRRMAAGGEPHCQGCGYNLKGNVSGKCPECGADLSGSRLSLPK